MKAKFSRHNKLNVESLMVLILIFFVTGSFYLKFYSRKLLNTRRLDIDSHNIEISNNLNAYKDLSFEFENDIKSSSIENSFNILDALEKDGCKPVPVSLYFNRCHKSRKHENCLEAESTKKDCSVKSSDETIATELTESFVVPNVFHYIFLGSNWDFTFLCYLSFRSLERFVKPEKIFIFGNVVLTGKWWNLTVEEVKNIYYVKVPCGSASVLGNFLQSAPSGKPYAYKQHSADVLRLEILLRYGGIYTDTDFLFLKSLDPLRKYSAAYGREFAGILNNGISFARRGSPIFRLLLEQYRSYDGKKEHYSEKSIWNLNTLAKLYPHLVYIEEDHLKRPNKSNMIFEGNFNWSQNNALHLWTTSWRRKNQPTGIEDIMKKNTTLGEISRFILFCSSEIK